MTNKSQANYDRLLDRYLKGYITESQLDRYVALNQLTEEEAEMMRAEKYYKENPEHRPEPLQ